MDFSDPKFLGMITGANFLSLQNSLDAQRGTEAELRKLNARQLAEYEEKKLMFREVLRATESCPHCSGRIPHGYEVCMHCTRDVIWHQKLIGKPGEEDKLRRKKQEEEDKLRRKKQEQDKALKRKEENSRSLMAGDRLRKQASLEVEQDRAIKKSKRRQYLKKVSSYHKVTFFVLFLYPCIGLFLLEKSWVRSSQDATGTWVFRAGLLALLIGWFLLRWHRKRKAKQIFGPKCPGWEEILFFRG